MSVKSFKFVSPGVFINEIDNSFIPKSADAIGPVIIGRSTRGLAMTPTKVESYSEFVQMFGDTVPGNAGGDVYRNGNYQSPMYGTYAAKAFLNANVAPLTFIRLLGQQHTNATSDGNAGWETTKDLNASLINNGGAYGLWVWPSASQIHTGLQLGTGTLAAVMYVEASGGVALSGTIVGKTVTTNATAVTTASNGAVILTDSNNDFTLLVSGSNLSEKIKFNFDDSSENFIRKVLNTNPQLTSDAGTFYPAASHRPYWLGETYEQDLRDGYPAGAISATSSISLVGEMAAAKANLTSSTVQLTDTAGTAITYQLVHAPAVNPSSTANTVNISASGSANTVVTALVNAINGSTGHNGTITAASGSTTVTFSQAVKGLRGNNSGPIVTDSGNGNAMARQGRFTGGTDSAGLTGGGTSLIGTGLAGVVLPIALNSDVTKGPHNKKGISSQEAKAGWFVGQDLGTATDCKYEDLTKLFRLVGRGHGEWLSSNAKVSIEKIRESNTTTSPYGTFSIVIRMLNDTDSKVQVLERFDNLTLDPGSPNFISRRIGDKYAEWDSTNRILKTYGEYDNQSKFVYVEVDPSIEGGASGLETLLPFGYYGPPKFKDVKAWDGVATVTRYVTGAAEKFLGLAHPFALSGAIEGTGQLEGTLAFPIVRLRHSASDGGLPDQTNAYFGWQNTREPSSTRPDASAAEAQRLLSAQLAVSDPTAQSIDGVDSFAYIFTLDDVKQAAEANGGVYYYESGSRAGGTSKTAGGTYKTLLDAGYDRFTAPFVGGFDGFDIKVPDPLYNRGMTAGTSTELNSYIYNTWKRAVDTVADPELIDMNMLVAPGLTFDALTTHMIDVCEERADSLALIDLANVYVPAHETYNSNKKDRIATTPAAAATALKDRRLDSSYGCTFYPWVQTRDQQTGRLIWIPPTVAMAGVLASSQAKSDVWFAPAGFNRGGLTDGAAGIPVTGITERLSAKNRDILYEARINPIASFPSSGIVVFGQKTLQERQSALDRINVRRLVIYLKKQISILSTQVLFEQNVQATWNRFKALIEPFLANVKVQFGITDYRLILDESTTTPDLIDQNILYAKIMIKPARAIEYIAIDFVVASTGASFDD